MSYFVFGLIDLADIDTAGQIRARVSFDELNVIWGAQINQQTLFEMLGRDIPDRSVPFLLTKWVSEDTSDSLVSPYVAGVEASADSFAVIGRWLVAVLASPEVERVRVWMTEGYETAFKNLDLSAQQFAAELKHRVLAEGDVPSLRVTVAR